MRTMTKILAIRTFDDADGHRIRQIARDAGYSVQSCQNPSGMHIWQLTTEQIANPSIGQLANRLRTAKIAFDNLSRSV